MNRGLWFFGEVLAGVLGAGAISAIVVPLVARLGRDPGPAAVWITLAVSVVLCVAVGERLRKGRWLS